MLTEGILFLDIETVSAQPSYDALDEQLQGFWKKKSAQFLSPDKRDDESIVATSYEDRAAIFSEFGKIICISVGYLFKGDNGRTFRVKSFVRHDEKEILNNFIHLINTRYNNPDKVGFCGHNIREFDIPYICRRCVIHNIELPPILDLRNKKPWEVKYIFDTLEMWRFGDYKHYITLALLAHVLEIPTPKDDIDGSMVGTVYWKDNDLTRIQVYCQKDVVTTARVYCRLNSEAFAADDQIQIID
jgi:DNA polymerase elongation subunit (family B)